MGSHFSSLRETAKLFPLLEHLCQGLGRDPASVCSPAGGRDALGGMWADRNAKLTSSTGLQSPGYF